MKGLCKHDRMVGTAVCLECPSGTAEDDVIYVDDIVGTNAYIDGQIQPKREGATYVECTGNSQHRAMCMGEGKCHCREKLPEPNDWSVTTCSFCNNAVPAYCCPKCSGFDNDVGKKSPQMLAEYWLAKYLEAISEINALRSMQEKQEIGRRLPDEER